MSASRQQYGNRGSYLDDYVNVATRVSQFHERYPNGRIVTDYQLTDNGHVIFHSKVYRDRDDAEPSATGTAIDSIDIKQSTFEKVETASVGRALAFLNFETKKGLASREEMEKHEGYQTGRQLQAVESTDPGLPPTPQQINTIKGLRAKLKITSPLDFSKLTYGTAEKYIADLRSKEQE